VLVFIFLWHAARQRTAKLKALQIANVDHMTGVEFEQYIGALLQSQGYHVRYTSTTGDYGVDLVATKNQHTYAIQAKRYSGTVGNHAIAEAVGGMKQYKCDKAVVVTSNYFTPNARVLAAVNQCVLVDREK